MDTIGRSRNCRDGLHAPACTSCTCSCHAVNMPASVKELARRISAKGRAQMEAEQAEWAERAEAEVARWIA
jgi:hypothetical protein